MSDSLPDSVSFVSAIASQGTVGTNAGAVYAALGALEPGASATVTITVLPNSEGTMTNNVSVAYNPLEPDLVNNVAEAVAEVLSPVTITNQPASLTVFVGDTVTFSVGVSGTPPFQYQWAFNGVAIPGATDATLTLPNVTADQAGFYSVTVSQVRGPETSYEVYSRFAILEVFP